jgi:hypothetical protein
MRTRIKALPLNQSCGTRINKFPSSFELLDPDLNPSVKMNTDPDLGFDD